MEDSGMYTYTSRIKYLAGCHLLSFVLLLKIWNFTKIGIEGTFLQIIL